MTDEPQRFQAEYKVSPDFKVIAVGSVNAISDHENIALSIITKSMRTPGIITFETVAALQFSEATCESLLELVTTQLELHRASRKRNADAPRTSKLVAPVMEKKTEPRGYG